MDIRPSRTHLNEQVQHQLANVTQLVSTSQPVTCNSREGRITMFAALPAQSGNQSGISFVVNNTYARADSHILVSCVGTTSTGAATRLPLNARVESIINGSFAINIYNGDSQPLTAPAVVVFHISA